MSEGSSASRPPQHGRATTNPIQCYDILHDSVPPGLDGFRILHLTDLHVGRRSTRAVRELAARPEPPDGPPDLIVLTGDAMSHPGDEPHALAMLERLAASARAPIVGIFGNHDSDDLVRRAGSLPIRWLRNEMVQVHPDLAIVGTSWPEDLLACPVPARPSFRLCLVHHPTEIHAASRMGMDLVLAGHTHGGQVRLTPDHLPHTSCDLPGPLASGVLRLDRTTMVISRGLGTVWAPIRLRCPAQAPLLTLRRGPVEASPTLRRVIRW
ncbi:MAG: metallophosphoesterase [Phycisphaerales bacterium]|nr:metallophosphoesterase [Phycisphaerales bacterium]